MCKNDCSVCSFKKIYLTQHNDNGLYWKDYCEKGLNVSVSEWTTCKEFEEIKTGCVWCDKYVPISYLIKGGYCSTTCLQRNIHSIKKCIGYLKNEIEITTFKLKTKYCSTVELTQLAQQIRELNCYIKNKEELLKFLNV